MLLNVHLLPAQLTFYSVAACLAQCPECRSWVKVEMAVLASPPLTVPTVSVDVKRH